MDEETARKNRKALHKQLSKCTKEKVKAKAWADKERSRRQREGRNSESGWKADEVFGCLGGVVVVILLVAVVITKTGIWGSVSGFARESVESVQSRLRSEDPGKAQEIKQLRKEVQTLRAEVARARHTPEAVKPVRKPSAFFQECGFASVRIGDTMQAVRAKLERGLRYKTYEIGLQGCARAWLFEDEFNEDEPIAIVWTFRGSSPSVTKIISTHAKQQLAILKRLGYIQRQIISEERYREQVRMGTFEDEVPMQFDIRGFRDERREREIRRFKDEGRLDQMRKSTDKIEELRQQKREVERKLE